MALVGAIWASLFFLMLLLSAVRGGSAATLVPGQSPPLWHALLDYVILPLGLAAPIATTVLGVLAIREIRSSDGERYGLSLALFDALLFPLLLLDFFVLWICGELAVTVIRQEVMSPPAARAVLGQIVPVVTIILGDYYVATRAWSLIRRQPPGQ